MKNAASAVELLALLLLLGGFALPVLAEGRKPERRPGLPLLLDTDLGDDIDDAFALALVLARPELDLRGVTTVHGDAHTRALIACRFLHAVGQGNIPVAAGAAARARPEARGQFQYGLRPGRGNAPDPDSAADFLYKRLKARPGELTLLALGPLTNVAELLRRHPDCKPWIKRIVLMGGAIRKGYDEKSPVVAEWNIRSDVQAAQAVFGSGVPLLVAPLDATVDLKLDAARCRRIFQSGGPVGRELHALYQLWDKGTPTLFDPLAAALCFEEKFCKIEPLRLVVDDQGFTRVAEGTPNARVATATDREEFLDWFVRQLTAGAATPARPGGAKATGKAGKLSGLVPINNATVTELQQLPGIGPVLARRIIEQRRQKPFQSVDDLRRVRGIGKKILQRLEPLVTVEDEPRNVAVPVAPGGMPHRVHVIQDFETDGARRWWLCGKPETKNVPPGSRRACRGVLTNDFDDRQGDPAARYTAVVFNPVPGPRLGKNPRLGFRFWIRHTDALRVQIYSLTRGYHRQLVLTDLPQGRWQAATVDLTTARRSDGSGGPLAEGERVDDIQFYADPAAELILDDIVLYDAAPPAEARPFPQRLLFTAWFHTGRQEEDWPGDFEIVRPEPGRPAKAARSVPHPPSGVPWLRLQLRGERPLGDTAHLRFRYRLRGADALRVLLANGTTGESHVVEVQGLARDTWAEATLAFTRDSKRGDGTGAKPGRGDLVDEIQFLLPTGAELLVSDVLLYEPGVPRR